MQCDWLHKITNILRMNIYALININITQNEGGKGLVDLSLSWAHVVFPAQHFVAKQLGQVLKGLDEMLHFADPKYIKTTNLSKLNTV